MACQCINAKTSHGYGVGRVRCSQQGCFSVTSTHKCNVHWPRQIVTEMEKCFQVPSSFKFPSSPLIRSFLNWSSLYVLCGVQNIGQKSSGEMRKMNVKKCSVLCETISIGSSEDSFWHKWILSEKFSSLKMVGRSNSRKDVKKVNFPAFPSYHMRGTGDWNRKLEDASSWDISINWRAEVMVFYLFCTEQCLTLRRVTNSVWTDVRKRSVIERKSQKWRYFWSLLLCPWI